MIFWQMFPLFKKVFSDNAGRHGDTVLMTEAIRLCLFWSGVKVATPYNLISVYIHLFLMWL